VNPAYWLGVALGWSGVTLGCLWLLNFCVRGRLVRAAHKLLDRPQRRADERAIARAHQRMHDIRFWQARRRRPGPEGEVARQMLAMLPPLDCPCPQHAPRPDRALEAQSRQAEIREAGELQARALAAYHARARAGGDTVPVVAYDQNPHLPAPNRPWPDPRLTDHEF